MGNAGIVRVFRKNWGEGRCKYAFDQGCAGVQGERRLRIM